MDIEGYGRRQGQAPIDRLLEDIRTLSPAGIERIAKGWEKRGSEASFDEAERAALHAIEAEDRGAAWDELRIQLLGLTERGQPMVAWRQEHGDIGHRAEDALLAAALALTAGAGLGSHHAETLVRPMAEGLPWLVTAVASLR